MCACPPGFHTTAREPKRAHLRAPVFKNTTKIQRENPQETFKVGEGKKKSEILGGLAGGGFQGGFEGALRGRRALKVEGGSGRERAERSPPFRPSTFPPPFEAPLSRGGMDPSSISCDGTRHDPLHRSSSTVITLH